MALGTRKGRFHRVPPGSITLFKNSLKRIQKLLLYFWTTDQVAKRTTVVEGRGSPGLPERGQGAARRVIVKEACNPLSALNRKGSGEPFEIVDSIDSRLRGWGWPQGR